MGDSPAKAHVTKRIEQLNQKYQSLKQRITELESLASRHVLSDMEFDLLRRFLTVFKDDMDEMTVEQKRAAVCTIVRKVVWDDVNAHVILYGDADDDDMEDDLPGKTCPLSASKTHWGEDSK